MGAGGTIDVEGGAEATRLGELVPMNVSASNPSEFHLTPCGKCFLTYFWSSLRISMNVVCHSL